MAVGYMGKTAEAWIWPPQYSVEARNKSPSIRLRVVLLGYKSNFTLTTYETINYRSYFFLRDTSRAPATFTHKKQSLEMFAVSQQWLLIMQKSIIILQTFTNFVSELFQSEFWQRGNVCLKYCESYLGFYLAQDRNRRRTVVNMVMNLSALKIVFNFFSGWANVGISKDSAPCCRPHHSSGG